MAILLTKAYCFGVYVGDNLGKRGFQKYPICGDPKIYKIIYTMGSPFILEYLWLWRYSKT
ncbi:hypothetical protein ACJX0J_009660, partial [Zea mays]